MHLIKFAILLTGVQLLSGQSWINAGPWGGRATALAISQTNPRILLAGAHQCLLYKSTDGGSSWARINFPEVILGEIQSILIDKVDPNHYWVATAGPVEAALFESRNAGVDWRVHLRGLSVYSVLTSPNDHRVIIAASNRGVFRSLDGGLTWHPLFNSPNLSLAAATAVALDGTNDGVIYVGTPHLPWKTTDSGKSWFPISNGMIDDSDIFSFAIDPRTSRVFASACSGLYLTSDGGNTWRRFTKIPDTHRRIHVVALSPSGDRLYAATTLGLLESRDVGNTWAQLTDTQANGIAFQPGDPRRLYVADENGIWRSETSPEDLRPSNFGLVSRRVDTIAESKHYLYTADGEQGTGSSLFLSDDDGINWRRVQPVEGLENVRLIGITGVPRFPGVLIGAASNGIFISRDDGHRWQRLDSAAGVLGQIRAVLSASTETGPLLAAATEKTVSISRDMGEHWTASYIPGSGSIQRMALGSSGRMVVSTASALYEGSADAHSWLRLSLPLNGGYEIKDIAIADDKSDRLAVATTRGLLISVDHGRSWHASTNGLPLSSIESIIFSSAYPSIAYVISRGVLYVSTNGGNAWRAVPSTFNPHVRRLWASRHSSKVFGLTDNVGIVHWDFSGIEAPPIQAAGPK